jgi:hypothetical protein
MDKKVGRFEKIFFPELNIKVDSKIDTGAYSVSLHVEDINEVDGKLYFWVGDESNKFIYDDFNIISVKSSFGKNQKRYSIKLKMHLGKLTYDVFVSLSDRKKMKFPCLIGRKFLHKHGFLVDVRKKNLHDRNKKM